MTSKEELIKHYINGRIDYPTECLLVTKWDITLLCIASLPHKITLVQNKSNQKYIQIFVEEVKLYLLFSSGNPYGRFTALVNGRNANITAFDIRTYKYTERITEFEQDVCTYYHNYDNNSLEEMIIENYERVKTRYLLAPQIIPAPSRIKKLAESKQVVMSGEEIIKYIEKHQINKFITHDKTPGIVKPKKIIFHS